MSSSQLVAAADELVTLVDMETYHEFDSQTLPGRPAPKPSRQSLRPQCGRIMPAAQGSAPGEGLAAEQWYASGHSCAKLLPLQQTNKLLC
jgi:hypothetical protein